MIFWISAVVGLLVAATILFLIRRDKLHVRHGVFWLLLAFAFAGLGFAPTLVDWLARVLGVGYPPVLAIVAIIAVLVIKILMMDIDQAHQEVQLQRLIQRVAMLEGSLQQRTRIDQQRAQSEHMRVNNDDNHSAP
ncbi:DUF2304 domain-containing protein [Gilvimarinus algae]|uniref:DUF2304 domain-containing protein n=1 Tax=Gilvimarinus algae TaxID=3058037 RepID=A0ABT8TI37_9GAMM|nr:DUF2304 domain-containing protein [Gilvimarinus sp. SDUM040014]MDO3383245.1 DUF2304 domain-containing protein [Gilvimarinus sp. SDUM040014]